MKSAGLSRVALVVDDEPEYLDWVQDYLSSLGVATEFARTLPDGLAALARRKFAVVLVDLEIPAPGASEHLGTKESTIVAKYPGIAAASYARNHGYKSREVMVYSVHDDDLVDAELRRLDCPYVLKGRASVLKYLLRLLLSQRVRSSSKPEGLKPGRHVARRRR